MSVLSEQLVLQYTVSLYLLRAIELDRHNTEQLRLGRAWQKWMEELSIRIEKEHIFIKKTMKRTRIRILELKLLPSKMTEVHYMEEERYCQITFFGERIRGLCEEMLLHLCYN